MPLYRIASKNVLFIHVPKTGGSSIERVLGEYGEESLHDRGRWQLRPAGFSLLTPSLPMQHFHGALLQQIIPPRAVDYTFMVVRDPVSRLISEYGHARRRRRIDANLPFANWAPLMLRLAGTAPSFSNNHFRPQHEFEAFSPEVFHFESGVPEIMAKVFAKLGMPAPKSVPHEKPSAIARPHVPEPVRQAIRSAYHGDYARYGYAVN